jgi:hypothetical protein
VGQSHTFTTLSDLGRASVVDRVLNRFGGGWRRFRLASIHATTAVRPHWCLDAATTG